VCVCVHVCVHVCVLDVCVSIILVRTKTQSVQKKSYMPHQPPVTYVLAKAVYCLRWLLYKWDQLFVCVNMIVIVWVVLWSPPHQTETWPSDNVCVKHCPLIYAMSHTRQWSCTVFTCVSMGYNLYNSVKYPIQVLYIKFEFSRFQLFVSCGRTSIEG
jgi:hypothetical protein